MTGSDEPVAPLLVIVGETASGKSALAVEIAAEFNGEIICADSRTVYKGLDIGTAKPSAEDRARVPHHGLDLVTPDRQYSAASYKSYAQQTINQVHERNRLPILVGGTGLYIDAVLYDFSFRSPADPVIRRQLEGLGVEQLQQRIRMRGLTMPENSRNPRHLVRTLETDGQTPQVRPMRLNTLILGLAPERKILEARIRDRVDSMLGLGFADEALRAAGQYGWDAPGLQAPGYRAFREYLEGAVDIETAKALFVKNDLHLAKRQRTWFHRNKSIHWLPTGEEYAKSVELITTELNT